MEEMEEIFVFDFSLIGRDITKVILEYLIGSDQVFGCNQDLENSAEIIQNLKDLALTCKFFDHLIKEFITKKKLYFTEVPYHIFWDGHLVDASLKVIARELRRNKKINYLFSLNRMGIGTANVVMLGNGGKVSLVHSMIVGSVLRFAEGVLPPSGKLIDWGEPVR